MPDSPLTVPEQPCRCRPVPVETVRRGDVFLGAEGDLVADIPAVVVGRVRVRTSGFRGWALRLAGRPTTRPYPDGTIVELAA